MAAGILLYILLRLRPYRDRGHQRLGHITSCFCTSSALPLHQVSSPRASSLLVVFVCLQHTVLCTLFCKYKRFSVPKILASCAHIGFVGVKGSARLTVALLSTHFLSICDLHDSCAGHVHCKALTATDS